MENLTEALILMVVGMSTVFIVLYIIIGLGNTLINLVNKYLPEAEVKPTTTVANTVNPKIANAINSAVAIITNGKGKVEKIEKL